MSVKSKATAKVDPFTGHRAGVAQRLRQYLQNIKEEGMGRDAAAAHAGVSYKTVLAQREASEEFARLEDEAERGADGYADQGLFKEAKKGNVGAVALWHKLRRGWYEPSRQETLTVDLASLTPEQLARLTAGESLAEVLSGKLGAG